MSNSEEKKQNSFWFSFKLKAQLLRIWFVKNIVLWLQIFLIVCLVFMLTGNITAETPILGIIIYPFFKPLVDEIVNIVAEKEMNGLMDFFAIAISILTSVGLFTMKAKRIAQSDIKSDKLKIALIKANMYFNKDGRLVKKTEKMVGMDLDGDGVIEGEEGEAKVPTNIFSGIGGAIKEFKTIITADLSEAQTKEDASDKYEDVLRETNLKDNEEAFHEIKETIKEGSKDLMIDAVNDEIDERIEAIDADETLNVSEKKEKKNLFSKLKGVFSIWFHKKDKEETKDETTENDETVIINNIDTDAEIEEETVSIKTVESQVVATTEVKKEEKKQEDPKIQIIKQNNVSSYNKNTIDNGVADFLSRMKK